MRPQPARRPPARRLLLPACLALLAVQPGPAGAQSAAASRAVIARELAIAASFLCADCNNDIEAEGVNRPMRRVMLAGGGIARAAQAADDAPDGVADAAIRAGLARIRAALEEVDEGAALEQIQQLLSDLRR
jgi:hypothetical protein